MCVLLDNHAFTCKTSNRIYASIVHFFARDMSLNRLTLIAFIICYLPSVNCLFLVTVNFEDWLCFVYEDAAADIPTLEQLLEMEF